MYSLCGNYALCLDRIRKKTASFPFLDRYGRSYIYDLIRICISKIDTKKHIENIFQAYSINLFKRKILRYLVPFTIAFAIQWIYYFKSHKMELTFHNLFFYYLTGGNGPGGYYIPLMFQLTFLFPLIYFLIHERDSKGLKALFWINAVLELMKTVYGMNLECYRLLIIRYIFALGCGCYLAIGKKKSTG